MIMYGRIKDFNLHIVTIAVIFVSEFAVPIRGDDNDLHVTYVSRQYTPDDTNDALYNLRRMPSAMSKLGYQQRYHDAVSYLDTSKEKRDSGVDKRRYMWRGLSPFHRIFKKSSQSLENDYRGNDHSAWENDWIHDRRVALPDTYKATETLMKTLKEWATSGPYDAIDNIKHSPEILQPKLVLHKPTSLGLLRLR